MIAQAVHDPAPHERPDIDELLAFWQPLLRLADWDILARYERHLDRSGWCSMQVAYKRAEIRIMDPLDWNDAWRPYDAEKFLVHELCHLHFAVFNTENGSLLGIAEEQAVESFARALIALKRRAPA